jgi:hypothetical protein
MADLLDARPRGHYHAAIRMPHAAAPRGGGGRMSGPVLSVYNPMGYPPKIVQVGMAQRPASLEGKTVYLIDCRFDDSDLLLRQMGRWLNEHMPSVTTVYRSKAGIPGEDDPELWAEAKEKADAVILGVGH